MTRWRDADVYEVNAGDVWQVGDHVFFCTDVTEDSPFRRFVASQQVDLLYSDLPWSNGQMRYYRTLSGMEPPPYDWQQVARAVISLTLDPWGSHSKAPQWIVSDRFGADEVETMLPGTHYARWWMEEYCASPGVRAVMHYSGEDPKPMEGEDFASMSDEIVPLRILEDYGDRLPAKGTIVDPTSRLGAASRCAEKHGWRAICNELSPPRLSAQLRKLEKLSGKQPVKVDEVEAAA